MVPIQITQFQSLAAQSCTTRRLADRKIGATSHTVVPAYHRVNTNQPTSSALDARFWGGCNWRSASLRYCESRAATVEGARHRVRRVVSLAAAQSLVC